MTGLLTIIGLGTTTIYVVYLLLRNRKEAALSAPTGVHPILMQFKSSAKQYAIDFDKCQFKDSSYLNEVEQHNTDYILAASMVGSTIGYYHTPVVRQEIVQSVLFFTDGAITKGKRFFQTFDMDTTTLKYHVMMGNIVLYIDQKDANKYYFDMKIEE